MPQLGMPWVGHFDSCFAKYSFILFARREVVEKEIDTKNADVIGVDSE